MDPPCLHDPDGIGGLALSKDRLAFGVGFLPSDMGQARSLGDRESLKRLNGGKRAFHIV